MRWVGYLPVLAGLLTMKIIGDSRAWLRTIAAMIAGLVVGMAADIALPWALGLSNAALERRVLVPLIGPYGPSMVIFLLPFAILGAAVAARRVWVRPRDRNDLRN